MTIALADTASTYASAPLPAVSMREALDDPELLGREHAQVVRRRQVGEIVFLLSRLPVFTNKPNLLAGQMLPPLVPDPLNCSVRDPQRALAKRALSFPFVPVRQLMVCHLASASMTSAGNDGTSGTCRCRGHPRSATGQIILTSAGYTLRCRGTPTERSVCGPVSPWRNGALIP